MAESTSSRHSALAFSYFLRFYQSISLVSEFSLRRETCLLLYLDDWAIIAKSCPHLLEHLELLPFFARSRVAISREKLDLEPTSNSQCFRMLIDFTQGRGYQKNSWIVRFWNVVANFIHLSSAVIWQQILGHMASLEQSVPRGRVRMWSFQWQLQSLWSPAMDDPATPVPSLEDSLLCFRRWLQEDRWAPEVPLQVPLHLFCTQTCWRLV